MRRLARSVLEFSAAAAAYLGAVAYGRLVRR